MTSSLLPGTEVVARGLRWEVVTVESLGAQTLYRLRGLEGAMAGKELDLLSPFEAIEPVMHELRPDRAAPLRNWLVYHQAFLLDQALGPHALLAVQPGRLRLEPYQLVPVVRALHMSRVRLLLADGVGLGKTIQAGLVITELMARRVAHRILVVSPAGPLLEQWKFEMAQRFGLRLEVIDRGYLEEVRRSTELGANPFDHISLGLASIDFLKQERVLDQLERTSYDVIVIDEAHHCMDLGAAQEREDSQRRRLAEVLARRCDAFLLLTATPHDGNDRSFASLCELLDPSLVDGRGMLRGERYRPHVIRRLKSHVPGFKTRIVEPRPVTASPTRHPAFVAVHRALLDLIAPELRRAFRARRYSDVLAFIALLKRSVSTVAACKTTLTVVADRFQRLLTEGAEEQESRRQRLRTLRDYHRKLERFGTVSPAEEQEQFLLEAEELAQQLAGMQREVQAGSRSLTRVSTVVEALDELVTLAEAAERQDPKLAQLVVEIADIRECYPRGNVIIYTEYTDSQRAVVQALQEAGVGAILTMSGDDPDSARIRITDRFRSQNGLVLVSTDAAAEGLNLHERCHHLIHLELPFNPNRLEQRNGRIDRYGQQHDPVVRYLFLRGTFEERILLRLIAKYERQRARLTFVPNTLGLTVSTDVAAERLLKGLMEDDMRLFQDEHTPIDFVHAAEDTGMDEVTEELLEEVDRTLKGFEQTTRLHAWLGDLGMNAETQLLTEAERARTRGCLSRDLLRYHPLHPRCPEYMRAAEWERRVKTPQGYAATTSGSPIAFLDSAEVSSGVRLHNAWRRPRAGGRGPSLERVFRHLLERLGGITPDADHIVALLEFLQQGSFVVAVDLYGAREGTRLLQVNADVVRLQLVQEEDRLRCEVCGAVISGAHMGWPCPRCHGRLIAWPESDITDNRTVRRIRAATLVPLVAGEHTAQIPNNVRVELEEDFKAVPAASKVNVLACSPTLEMGIDVGGLDAVVLRNVPPRPDNYAQRGGRAGRRTRVGLVVGYARNTPHDQYFYDRPTEMIAGEVPAPVLALGNRDVILRHLYAITFSAADPGLAGKMVEYVSPTGEVKQEAVDQLIAAVVAQKVRAVAMAREAWGADILSEAGLDEVELRSRLGDLPGRIQDVVDRTARQVRELRTALDLYATELRGARAGARAGELVARLLGIQSDRERNAGDADDRSAGYPLRRFAEFGILPGYEFPTEPAALRLLGDAHEEDPVTVARRFGIAQFQPEAQVYARTRRWKVIGLDLASPWNPQSDGPTWLYRLCQTCQLRFGADHPRCPRCGTDLPGQALPAAEFAGFVARRDENPILDEEERFATANLVATHPQWDGQVVGRWTVGPGWTLRWSRGEEVRWLNEGLRPSPQELKDGLPLLHTRAKGYLVCEACGRMLRADVVPNTTGGRRRARSRTTQHDVYGHGDQCPKAGVPPRPLALRLPAEPRHYGC